MREKEEEERRKSSQEEEQKKGQKDNKRYRNIENKKVFKCYC